MESEAANNPVNKGSMIDLSKFRSTSFNPLARLPSEQLQIYKWAKGAGPDNEKAQMALQKFEKMGIK